MAIYHFSVKNISRRDGRSAVAAAAYRSSEKLIDERQGKEQDYTQKTGVELKKIYAPKHTNPELLERNNLWNSVEKFERRKDSNLAREFEIAFPHELNQEQREQMLDELSQEIVKRHGVIVDAAIHAPHTASGSDERNYHAHVMFTGRQIDPETGYFAKKKHRDFNKENSSKTVNEWRERFADMVNKHLARAGSLAEVDHRSYAEQNNGLEATAHEGYKVTQLRRQGIDTQISLKNDAIKARNAEKIAHEQIIKGLDQEILATEKNIAQLRTESQHSAKNTLNHTYLHEQKNNGLERKIEPNTANQHTPTIADKIAILDQFKKKISAVAQEIYEQEVKTLKSELAEVRAETLKAFENYENFRNSKPMNPFKIGSWQAELLKIANEYENGIRAKHEDMRGDYERLKNRGVTREHELKAQRELAQKHPNQYQKILDLQREVEAHNEVTRATQKQDREPDRGKGR